jgi:peptidoglycan/LPS O-acetylase OafA/YrhL
MIYGHFAVSVFIVLSGFCLMLPITRGDGTLRGGAATFFRKRARRILPPYYLALGFSLLILIGIYGRTLRISARDLCSHLLLIHNLSPTTIGGINGAFWSIAVEWQIYFLFPLLVYAWRRWGAGPTLTVTVALAVGSWFGLRGQPLSGLTPHYVALFAFGMLGSELAFSPAPEWVSRRARVLWPALLATLTAVLIAWCVRWGWEEALGPLQAVTDILVGVCMVALLVTAARPNRVGRLLAARPLAFIGTFAYSIYLVHLPLLIACWSLLVRLRLPSEAAFALLAFGCGPLIVGIAYLFHLGCERPFLTKRSVRSTPSRCRHRFL